MSTPYSRVCFTKPDGKVPVTHAAGTATELNAVALQENSRNGSIAIGIAGAKPVWLGETIPESPEHLVITTGKLWKTGKVLNVHFARGTAWQRGKVKDYAPEWSKYANVTFAFDAVGDPDVLIDFNPTLGSWSYLGTDCLYFTNANNPSMNLGWILDTKSEAEIRQAILHEFGHTLGAVHEHESPYNTIPWNKKQIYQDLSGPPNNWSKSDIDGNMFQTYSSTEVQGTKFDPSSIMLYSYPRNWTTDGKGTSFNTELSDHDKAYIAFCYPPDTYDAGFFHTQQLKSSGPAYELETYRRSKASALSPLAYGLTSFDLDAGADLEVSSTAKDLNETSFTVGINLPRTISSKPLSASMTYLEVGRFPLLQTGTWTTEAIHPWNQPRATTSQRISFTPAFSSTPKVLCFLSGMHIAKETDWRVKVYASDIDRFGFTIHADTWADGILYTATATWLAFPSEQPHVSSGRLVVTDDGGSSAGAAQTTRMQTWNVAFGAVPKVFMALDEISADHTKDPRVRLTTSNVTPTGITWNLHSWGDSILYGAGASYFAWEEGQ